MTYKNTHFNKSSTQKTFRSINYIRILDKKQKNCGYMKNFKGPFDMILIFYKNLLLALRHYIPYEGTTE